MQKKPWKKPSDVSRLTFSKSHKGELIRIGGKNRGDIYVGRMRFKNGTVHRVAIKTFKGRLLDDELAKDYQKVIEDLRDGGVKLPKMAMLKIPTERTPTGEWVQVSQLFGSSKKGSKIETPYEIKTGKGRAEAITELTKVANAGYRPHGDLLQPFKKQSKGVIPFDLDTVVRAGKVSYENRAQYLKWMIENLAEDCKKHEKLSRIGEIKERKRLLNIAIETASSEMKETLMNRVNKDIRFFM